MNKKICARTYVYMFLQQSKKYRGNRKTVVFFSRPFIVIVTPNVSQNADGISLPILPPSSSSSFFNFDKTFSIFSSTLWILISRLSYWTHIECMSFEISSLNSFLNATILSFPVWSVFSGVSIAFDTGKSLLFMFSPVKMILVFDDGASTFYKHRVKRAHKVPTRKKWKKKREKKKRPLSRCENTPKFLSTETSSASSITHCLACIARSSQQNRENEKKNTWTDSLVVLHHPYCLTIHTIVSLFIALTKTKTKEEEEDIKRQPLILLQWETMALVLWNEKSSFN